VVVVAGLQPSFQLKRLSNLIKIAAIFLKVTQRCILNDEAHIVRRITPTLSAKHACPERKAKQVIRHFSLLYFMLSDAKLSFSPHLV
jgi:hypothetical protein